MRLISPSTFQTLIKSRLFLTPAVQRSNPMFLSGAHYLSLLLSGVVILAPVTAAAQTGAQAGTQRGVSHQNTGVTWLQPGTFVDSDSLMSICAPPPVKPVVKRKVVPSKSSAPRYLATPMVKAKAAPKRVARKPKAEPQPAPRMMCPLIQIGPSFMGMLGEDESIIPLPGDLIPEVSEMTLVTPRELPLSDITPVTPAVNGGRKLGPLIWLFGGGAGIGVFTKFGGGDPKNPEPPVNPPVIPEIPDGPPPITSTPEPGTLALMGTGLAALAGAVRRRKKKGTPEV